MITRISGNSRVYLSCSHIDMRKSINGLAAIVQGSFELDLFDGTLFVFCNKNKDKIKVLKWDKDGFSLYYKRREKGRFQWPSLSEGANTVNVSKKDLYRLLDGLIMEQFVPHKQYTIIRFKHLNFNDFSMFSLVFKLQIWYNKRMRNVEKSMDLSSLTKTELEAKVLQLSMEVESLSMKLSWYEEQYKLSRAQRFGPSSEQIPFDQLSFFNEAESEASAFTVPEPTFEEVKVPSKKKSKGRKQDITSGLPTITVEYRLSEEDLPCPQCGETLHEMKKEIHRELSVIPAQINVTEKVRYIYACRNCERNGTSTPIIPAPMPNPVIKNSLASPSMIAHIMQRKYVDAVPLYRQEAQFKKYGIKLSRQTLANWMIKSSNDWLRPMYNLMHQEILKKQVLHADETVLEVLREPGREAVMNSYMWVYVAGSAEIPIALYNYTQGRSGDFAKEFLKGFSGYLQTDGYAGYHKLQSKGHDSGIILSGCWAHARRKYD